MQRSWRILFVLLSVIMSVVILWTINTLPDNTYLYKPTHSFIKYFDGNFSLPKPSERKYKILFWTGFFGTSLGWESFYGSFYGSSCECQCLFTTNRSQVEDSHVVVFNARDVSNNYSDLPQSRKLRQIWLLHNTEPPWYTFLNMEYFNNVFNWTSFTRQDSDVPTFYGKTLPKSKSEIVNTDAMFERPLVASWMASNCISKNGREDYVRTLRQYIGVDRYGRCGEMPCLKGQKCHDILKQYKFYLAFENANCRDYVTEKFWRTLRLGIVPVVMSASGAHKKVAPPKSFIDTSGFKTAKSLAQYLKKVANNKTLYSSYLSWKNSYEIGGNYWCDMCRKLHSWNGRPQIYQNLDGWFHQDSCQPWNLMGKGVELLKFARYYTLWFLGLW